MVSAKPAWHMRTCRQPTKTIVQSSSNVGVRVAHTAMAEPHRLAGIVPCHRVCGDNRAFARTHRSAQLSLCTFELPNRRLRSTARAQASFRSGRTVLVPSGRRLVSCSPSCVFPLNARIEPRYLYLYARCSLHSSPSARLARPKLSSRHQRYPALACVFHQVWIAVKPEPSCFNR